MHPARKSAFLLTSSHALAIAQAIQLIFFRVLLFPLHRPCNKGLLIGMQMIGLQNKRSSSWSSYNVRRNTKNALNVFEVSDANLCVCFFVDSAAGINWAAFDEDAAHGLDRCVIN